MNLRGPLLHSETIVLPVGTPARRHTAAMAPAEAPQMFLISSKWPTLFSKCSGYSLCRNDQYVTGQQIPSLFFTYVLFSCHLVSPDAFDGQYQICVDRICVHIYFSVLVAFIFT